MPAIAERVAQFSTTVFSEFSALALEHGAVNLGQGFPDFDGPSEVKAAAARAIAEGHNQYAVSAGTAELRKAIAEHARRFYDLSIDPQSMVTVTSGATEALFDAILGLVNPGDEVVLFEPFYDSYVAAVQLAGAVARYVRLRPPDQAHPTWWFDQAELEQAFSARTRMVVVNTPQNPTGKVFTRSELAEIAKLCVKHDAIALCDEVYEHIVFAPAQHVPMATLPGMFERTVTVSSAGKTFSLTGWKVGWAMAAPGLLEGVQRVHQFVTFATATPFQTAVVTALRLSDAYFQQLTALYLAKRDLLVAALADCGLRPFRSEGTYFVMADTTAVATEDDTTFCRRLTREVRVAAIPPSSFYSPVHRAHARHLVRFAFCKTEPVLKEAARRLKALSPR